MHIKTAVVRLRKMLEGRSFDSARLDYIVWPALERYLQIISEASRDIPSDWKATYGPAIPWRQVADVGNRLGHAYSQLDANVLWSIVQNDLDPLEAAIDAMLADNGGATP